MQKFKTLFLLLALLTTFSFGAWTGGTSKPGNTKIINGKIFYEITTPEELAWFAAQVNSGNNAINAVLANDIVLGEATTSLATEVWTPIGWTQAKAFAGVFDGRGFGVYGMYIHSDYRDFNNLGLFGVIAKTGVVQNLLIQNADVISSLNFNQSVGLVAGFSEGILRNISAVGSVSGHWAGGIAGTASGKMDSVSFFFNKKNWETYNVGIVGRGIGTLTISHATNTNEGSSGHVSRGYCGGLVGYVDSGIVNIVNSTNSGSVSLFANAGGLVGYVGGGTVNIVNSTNVGNVSTDFGNSACIGGYAGGLVGYVGGGTVNIVNSTNVGNDSSSGYAGGLVGYVDGGTVNIVNSTNVGNVSSRFGHAGGLVGFVIGSASIVNCANRGIVSAAAIENSVENRNGYAGGLVGFVIGSMSIVNCANGGDVTSKVENSFNSFNDGRKFYVGGLVGYVNGDVEIIDSYNVGAVSGWDNSLKANDTAYVGGLAGYLSKNVSLKNVYSTAAIVTVDFTGVKGEAFVGALVGQSHGKIQNVYFDSDLLSISSIGCDFSASKIDVGGLSTANMRHNNQFIWILNTTKGKEESSGVWGWDSVGVGYPIFADTANKGVANEWVYKVVFLDYDGSKLKEESVRYGFGATAPNDPVREGYAFAGWNKSFEMVFSNLNITAIYEVLSSSSANSSSSSENPDAIRFGVQPHFGLQVQNRTVRVQNARVGENFAVLDMQGRVLRRGIVNSSELSFDVQNAGAYIVRVGTESLRVRVK